MNMPIRPVSRPCLTRFVRFTLPLLLLLASPLACRFGDRRDSTTRLRPDERRREAVRLTALAAQDRDDPERAEALLRQAMAADPYHGPAHGNLGVLLLEAGKLYDAAWQFQYAAKLMPNNPDPLFNLGIVYERAGKPRLAAEHYERLLTIAPDDVLACAQLARIYISLRRDHVRVAELLDAVSGGHPNADWRDWAQLQRIRMRSPKSATPLPKVDDPATRPARRGAIRPPDPDGPATRVSQ